MATDAKTRSADFDREAFLAGIEAPQRRAEAERLLAVFAEVTGYPPRMWGTSMVGFGRYAYRYDSGHSGESLATGFAPRNAPNPTGFAARSSAPEQEAADEPSHLPEAYPAEAPAEESGGCSMGCLATVLLIGFGLFLLTVIAKG